MKRLTPLAWVFLFGALGGALLVSWIAPSFIAWYFQPPVEFGVSCTDPIRWALQRLRRAQMWGLLAGGILAVALQLVLRRGRGAAGTGAAARPPVSQ